VTRKRQPNLFDATTLLERIGAAAVKCDAARRAVLPLKKERNALKCGDRDEASCWQTTDAVANWCEVCQLRDVIHREVLVAVRRRRALQRSLQRLCRKV